MGPLSRTRVLELGGIGPGPFGVMLLADLGAEVLRIERPGGSGLDADNLLLRGRPSIELDLKADGDREWLLDLVTRCDVLVEGFRPGVVDRLGIGPSVCRARNPRLVYASMTGWGQEGPYAQRAGHDINYIGVAGLLDTVGRAGERPLAPVNYTGDYGAGGMLLAFGIVSALLERERSGAGQLVDAAIVDGAALMLADIMSRSQAGAWRAERGTNQFDGGSHYYDTYETADGAHMAVGPIEAPFYERFMQALGMSDADEERDRPGRWGELKPLIAAAFRRRTQREWCQVFADLDACVTPVLPLARAPQDPHLRARGTFVQDEGRWQPAPAPRFDRTPARLRPAPSASELLSRWGVPATRPGSR